MRLLLDESLPRRLRAHLTGHSVKTVVEMGWRGYKNGRLLAAAAAEFYAFITADKNLPYQQNLATALIIVPAVGWTSASAVHRIPRRRWWTALRLSTLRCRVAGTMIKASCDLAHRRGGVGSAYQRALAAIAASSAIGTSAQRPDDAQHNARERT